MLQAAVLDCRFLDFYPFPDDGFVAPEIDAGRCDVVQALVVSLVVVVFDEGSVTTKNRMPKKRNCLIQP